MKHHQNSNCYPYVFWVNLSISGTSNFLGRRRLLEIQDCSQITGGTNISEFRNYNIGLYHQNSNGEPTAFEFDHGKLAGSVAYMGDSNDDRQWEEMAAETWNAYIS